MASDVMFPGEEGYDENRGAFNLLLDQRPAAIATPSSPAEAAAAIGEARSRGLRVTVQRTGHGADPLGPLDEVLLVRTAGLGGVEIDAEARRARVGAGVLWGEVVPDASEQGLAALHGSSKTVGIAGYMLGGGIGWYGRKHGLGCNSVTAIELVDASGAEQRVDAESDPELFWALRGGGGDFGLVTAVEFDLLPIAQVYAGALFFPIERAAEVLDTWLEWTGSAPDEVTSVGRVMAFPPFPQIPEPMRGKSFAIVEAVYLGDEAAGAELLAPLRNLGPVMDTFATVPPAVLADLHMDPPEPGPALYDGMLLGELDAAALETWLGVVGPGSGSPLLSAELRHTGGAFSRPAPGGGALDSLPGSFLQFAVGMVAEPGMRDPIVDRIDQLEEAVKPWHAGFLRSFSSRSIDPADAYSSETTARLRAAKAKYDPDSLFLSNQPVASD